MKNKLNLIITLITISIFLFTTIGYAYYNANVRTNGRVTLRGNGTVFISDVSLLSYSNLENPESPEFTSDSINFNLDFIVESNSNLDDDFKAEYTVTVSNTSFYDYTFSSSMFNPSVETTSNENMNVSYAIEDIDIGDTIDKLSSKTFKLTISMYPKVPGEYIVTGSTEVNLEQEEEHTGSLIGSIPKNTTLDLRNNVMGSVTLTVINSYDTSKTFSLSSANSNFLIVNAQGNSLGNMNINANTTQSYTIYIQRKNGVTFATDTQNMNLIFNNMTSNVSLGNITIRVPKDETLLDDDPPIISDVNATFVASNGKVNLSWSATDISTIDHFIIEVMNSSDQLVNTITTTNSNTNYEVSGLSNGTYYFKVYGVDSKNNNGKTKATTCTTNSGVCSRSASASYTWVFTVTYNLTNLSTNSSTEAIIGTNYTGQITANNNYSLPSSITVVMNGQTLRNGYTYNSNNGNITINNVNGNISITASGNRNGGICLVKGTKILLADGSYKNIENVNYYDLLKVWSYDTGSITYEYPIWIEKTSTTDHYQKTTFSDGTVLNTVGYHGIFSSTYNEFISVDDYSKFKVGTKVYKVINDKLKEVSVVKIETINKEVNYYHVVSTRYSNIIANDLLTTDGTVILSNLYGFNNNVTWNNDIRNSVINNKNNVYSYDELKDVLPYYMFKGLRAEEGKFLNNYGLDLYTFKYYLSNNQTNENMLLPVKTNSNNKRIFKVTTNKDNKLSINNLYEEGSYYVLPKLLGVNKWYSTSENKYYNSGDKVKVNYSMHFIAK